MTPELKPRRRISSTMMRMTFRTPAAPVQQKRITMSLLPPSRYTTPAYGPTGISASTARSRMRWTMMTAFFLVLAPD
jgi:hypothetical protein